MARLSMGNEGAFPDYVYRPIDVIDHTDRTGPFKDYCLGLMLPVDHKSGESAAAVKAPTRISSTNQSPLYFVGRVPWSRWALLAGVRNLALAPLQRHGTIEAWIADFAGFSKTGRHSAGIARQICGQLGKKDNCQIAVSLWIADVAGSLLTANRLCLLELWTYYPVRRRKAKIPDGVAFPTKPTITIDQIPAAQAAGVAPGVVLGDSGHGADRAFRTGLSAPGLEYFVVGQLTLIVCRPGEGHLLSARKGATKLADLADARHPGVHTVSAKLCWRIERGYQELTGKLGRGHCEGRSWRYFHPHANLCIRRSRIPHLAMGGHPVSN